MKSSGVSDQQAQFDERADKHDGRVLASDTGTTILRGCVVADTSPSRLFSHVWLHRWLVHGRMLMKSICLAGKGTMGRSAGKRQRPD